MQVLFINYDINYDNDDVLPIKNHKENGNDVDAGLVHCWVKIHLLALLLPSFSTKKYVILTFGPK